MCEHKDQLLCSNLKNTFKERKVSSELSIYRVYPFKAILSQFQDCLAQVALPLGIIYHIRKES